jgi:SpoIID/LytB domain protein
VVAIITLDLETAVASTVEAESAPDTPLEALKAQAVVARSYFVAGGGRHRDFDFCDLTRCQCLREPPAQTSSAAIATRDTRGIVVTFQVKPFAPMFSRSCAGRPRTPGDVGLPGKVYPYFSVLCDVCRKSPYRWSRRLSLTEAAPLLGQGESGRLAVDRRLGSNPCQATTTPRTKRVGKWSSKAPVRGTALASASAAQRRWPKKEAVSEKS